MLKNDGPTQRMLEYAALGFFISQCSLLEVALHLCIKQMLHIEDETAKLVIGEPRIGELLDLIKKAAVIRGYSKEQIEMLSELVKLSVDSNKVRQIVAHKPFFLDPHAMFFTNNVTAKSIGAIYEYRCTEEELNNLGRLVLAVSENLLYLVIAQGPIEATAINKIREQLALLQNNPLPKIPSPQPPPKLPKQQPQRKASQK